MRKEKEKGNGDEGELEETGGRQKDKRNEGQVVIRCRNLDPVIGCL